MKNHIIKKSYCVVGLALLMTITGCAALSPMSVPRQMKPRGYIYQHIVRPLDTNMHRTPTMVDSVRKGGTKHLSYDVVDIYWGSNGIGDIARKNGLTDIYAADVETLRILGIWTKETVHVYGK